MQLKYLIQYSPDNFAECAVCSFQCNEFFREIYHVRFTSIPEIPVRFKPKNMENICESTCVIAYSLALRLTLPRVSNKVACIDAKCDLSADILRYVTSPINKLTGLADLLRVECYWPMKS